MAFEFNNHVIKAITIKQPHATMIVNGNMDVENRTWFKKLDDDVCKNWLFVHSSTKRISKKKLQPSSILGMMHINCVGKLKDSVHRTEWESGPVCWYIDAVIKFDIPVLTTGRLGQWNPDPSLHRQLKVQINNSMYNIIPMDNIKFIQEKNIYYAVQRGKYMTWSDVINSLTNNMDTFIYKLIRFLINIEHKSYFWECDQVSLNQPFRFAIFNSKTLSHRKQDNTAFNGSINCKKSSPYAISFPSLSKNIDLVVPCKYSKKVDYTSISTFSRTAPIKQQVAFWNKVGENIKVGDWVSTSGLGVAWLHVRIARRPKYYHAVFDKNPDKISRENM